MAIEYKLLLKSKRLSEAVLLNKLNAMGYLCKDYEKTAKGICIDLNEQAGFIVYLFDKGGYPYNIWETDFLETDFLAERVLEFRLDKNYSEIEQRYRVMFEIIFDLAAKLNEDGILINSGGTELCFFQENQPVLLNNESGIWNETCFQDIIQDRDKIHEIKIWEKQKC